MTTATGLYAFITIGSHLKYKMKFHKSKIKQRRVSGAIGADVSECGLYQYSLWRIWDDSKPLVMFIGLNPATINAGPKNPTIRRAGAIAQNLGYGGFYFCNCFAYISANPKELHAETLAATIKNADVIKRVAASCADIIFAWGNFKEAKQTGIKLIQAFPQAKVLGLNKNGSPKHPLFCKKGTKPFPILEISVHTTQ